MKLMLAAVPLAVLAPISGDDVVTVSEATAVAAPLASSGLTYQDLLLTEQEDVQGCVLRIGTHLIELEELIFGTDAAGHLMVAYAQGKNLEGAYVHHDRLDRAVVLFDSIDQVEGVFVRANGEAVWAEKVVFGRLPGGELSTLSLQGFQEFGAASSESIRQAVPLCLTASNNVDCVPTSGCTDGASCAAPVAGDDGDITCSCSPTWGGTCEPEYTLECPSNGLCPVNKTCKNKSSDPSKCSCQGDI